MIRKRKEFIYLFFILWFEGLLFIVIVINGGEKRRRKNEKGWWGPLTEWSGIDRLMRERESVLGGGMILFIHSSSVLFYN